MCMCVYRITKKKEKNLRIYLNKLYKFTLIHSNTHIHIEREKHTYIYIYIYAYGEVLMYRETVV